MGEGRAIDVPRGEHGVAGVVLVMVCQHELIGVDLAHDRSELDGRVRRSGIDQQSINEIDTGRQVVTTGHGARQRKEAYGAVFCGAQHDSVVAGGRSGRCIDARGGWVVGNP